MNEVSKVAGHKAIYEKSAAFMYVNNEQSENEYTKQFHLQYMEKNKILRN